MKITTRFLSIMELDEIMSSKVDLIFDFLNSYTKFVGNELYTNLFQEIWIDYFHILKFSDGMILSL